MQQAFNILLIVMAVLAVVVFIALFFVDAGYGMLLNRKWGKTVSNKVGWFVMESPVFLLMTVLWLMSDRRFEAAVFSSFSSSTISSGPSSFPFC